MSCTLLVTAAQNSQPSEEPSRAAAAQGSLQSAVPPDSWQNAVGEAYWSKVRQSRSTRVPSSAQNCRTVVLPALQWRLVPGVQAGATHAEPVHWLVTGQV
ncbi:MAG: hypothetical protein QM765_10570 [Myxococcales bacterium]